MVSIQEAHKIFDIWFDKVSSPFYTSDEKDVFIQRGLYNLINKYFLESGSHILERTARDLQDLSELVREVEMTTNESGEVTDADINTLLSGRDKMYILNASKATMLDCDDSYESARFVRHNDYWKQNRNSFKQATSTYPTYRIFSGVTKFNPSGISNVRMAILVHPLKPTLDDPTNSGNAGGSAVNIEIPEQLLNELVYLSLVEAGVAIREGDFYSMVSQEAMKNE